MSLPAQRAVATALHQHWKLYLVEGIVLVLLGVVAIVLPPLATLAVTILVGWLFLISGDRRTVHHILDAPGARLLVVARCRRCSASWSAAGCWCSRSAARSRSRCC